MSGESRPRPDVVARYRTMLPDDPRDPRDPIGWRDPRFAPPGEPSRTELGRYCDRIRAERQPRQQMTARWMDRATVIVPTDLDLVDGRWLVVHGARGHTGHPTRVVLDLDDPHTRLAFVAVAGVIVQHDLHPNHSHVDTHPSEAMT